MTPLCVDVADAAQALGLSKSGVRKLIETGVLPVVKFPSEKHEGETSRRVLIAWTDLEALVLKFRVVER